MRGQDMPPDSQHDRYVCFVRSPRAFYAGAPNRTARPLASSQPIRRNRFITLKNYAAVAPGKKPDRSRRPRASTIPGGRSRDLPYRPETKAISAV